MVKSEGGGEHHKEKLLFCTIFCILGIDKACPDRRNFCLFLDFFPQHKTSAAHEVRNTCNVLASVATSGRLLFDLVT